MEKEAVRTIAVKLMDKHNLLIKGWKFVFDNAKTRLGNCSHTKKIISLSKNYLPLVDEKEVIDTILHEIAHALVGRKQGHNHIWKQQAIEIGCNGQRLYRGEANIKAKYKGTCPICGKIIKRHRRKNISCGKCCGGIYNPKYLFIWTINND